MSQRASGYSRKENDEYQTPAWVTKTIVPHLAELGIDIIWEPASSEGCMSSDLYHAGFRVFESELTRGVDFLTVNNKFIAEVFENSRCPAVVTNPPFKLSQQFIERALWMTEARRGAVAMLLRVDYDSAATRQHLFRYCKPWCKKLVLTNRIVWFDRPGAAPSFNHAWFLWSWQHSGPATISYAAREED